MIKKKTKVCLKCLIRRDIKKFSKHRLKNDGLQSECKDCRNKYNSKYCKIYRRSLIGKYKSLAGTAKQRKIELTINLNEFIELIHNKECTYCSGQLAEASYGLDRKNNKIGYILKNCVACCEQCNMIKLNLLSHEEMLEMKPILIKSRIRRNYEQNRIS